MKMDPRTWFKKSKEQGPAYITKTLVVTGCRSCPHQLFHEYDPAVHSSCSITGNDLATDNDRIRPEECPLSTVCPSASSADIWEGKVIVEGENA